MKFCSKCGQQIKEGTLFCPACGTKQVQTNAQPVAPTAPVQPSDEVPQAAPQPTAPQFNFNEQVINNEKVQQFTVESKNYFKWLNQNIVNPQAALSTDLPIFGLVNFCLILLFSSLAFSHGVLSAVPYVFAQASFPLVFETLLSLACYLLVGVVVVYLLSDKIYKTKTSFIQAFDKVFAPASLAVYLSITSFVFSLLMNSSSMIFVLILALPFMFLNLSVMMNIYHTKDATGKKNRYYVSMMAIILYSILMFIVFMIVGNLIVSNSFNVIDELFRF